eukprot:Trichotokara_eunicae@DN2505_c0_g1_i3.p2
MFGPTGVADVVLYTPIVRNFWAAFGFVSSSKESLKNALKTENVFLYPGGLAELNMCDAEEELLYFEKRFGFVKLAMEAGVDIVPMYVFGNTQMYKLWKKKKKKKKVLCVD